MHVYKPYERIDIRNVSPEQFVEEMARRRNVDLYEMAHWVEEHRGLYKSGIIQKKTLTRRQNEKFSYISDEIYRGVVRGREFLSQKDVNGILRNLVDHIISR